MADDKTLSQVYYEEVEALKASGKANADAIREVANKHGKKENAIRGGIHQYKTKLSGGSTSGRTTRRRAAVSVDDLLSSARQSLESALALIDSEVDDAKAQLDFAQQRYDEVLAGVKDKKADIEKKLKALE